MLEDFMRELDMTLEALLMTADLSAREREVIDARWMHPGEKTLLGNVAKARHVTRERVRQVEFKAFRKLRAKATDSTMIADLGKQADRLQQELEAMKAQLGLLEAIRHGRPREAIHESREARKPEGE